MRLKLVTNFGEYEFNMKSADWEHVCTSEKLTGYKIPSQLSTMLENNLNTELA